MAKKTKKKRGKKKVRDVNQLAAFVVAKVTAEPIPISGPKKNPAAVALGRLGGLKGGPALRDKLTPEQRRESASKAARARWARHEKQP